MVRFALTFLTILLFSTPAIADPLTLSRQVLLPNGKPAVGAKVFVRTFARYNFPKVKPQAIETKTDKDGRYKVTIADQPGMTGYLLVDAPGAAICLAPIRSPISTDTIWDSSDPIKLSPGYFVEGRALDQQGVPITNAVVALAVLYPRFYMPMPLTLGSAESVPAELKARTDRDGRYRLRGIEGFKTAAEWSKVVVAYAISNRSGGLYLGDGEIAFDPGTKTAGEANLITMRRTEEIKGRVIDGVSGKPIPGAQIDFSPNRLWTPATSLHIETDRNGRFQAIGVLAETQARVSKSGYPDTGISFTHPTTEEVTIVLNPLVPFTGRLTDAERGGSPLFPTNLSVIQKRTLEEGATQISYGAAANDRVLLNDDAAFELEAPAGHVTLEFENQQNTSSHPYDEAQEFDLPASGAQNVTITLHRQPGILFKLDIDDPDRVNIMSPKNDIEIDITRSGEPDEIYEGYLATEFFFPVDKWGETVTIRILDRHKDGSKTDLIPPATYVADPKIWPVTIKVPPAPVEDASK